MGNWIQLTSGGGYDFETREIFGPYDIGADIAHPLAGENRYAGHTLTRWSVAIHSVAVARTIQRLTTTCGEDSISAAAGGLLHDLHESVIGDIPTPVAWAIDYDKVNALKEEVQLAIEERLGVPAIKRPCGWKVTIRRADEAALHIERQLMMAPGSREWHYNVPDPETLQTMHKVVREIISNGENKDGGYNAFMAAWAAYVGFKGKR